MVEVMNGAGGRLRVRFVSTDETRYAMLGSLTPVTVRFHRSGP
jgi:hypothetical protein